MSDINEADGRYDEQTPIGKNYGPLPAYLTPNFEHMKRREEFEADLKKMLGMEERNKQLEAEHARLKGQVTQLEEAFDIKNGVHEKLNKDYLVLKQKLSDTEIEMWGQQAKAEHFEKLYNELSGNSGELGWQSADKLPEEEGDYAVELTDYSRVFRDLELLKMEIDMKIVKRYLKLPDVEE